MREDRKAWRVTEQALEIRVEPGNLWGRANNAKNVLVRPAPDPTTNEIEIVVTVENHPTAQYEQANLAWYYDDSHMVKLGLELVDGRLCVVMGREAGDKTRTLGLHRVQAHCMQLRLRVAGSQIRGHYRPAGTESWLEAGSGELPVPSQGQAQISLHGYQGPADVEHWARFSEFRLTQVSNTN